jgi:REP element-mobilizing transposase RayT
MAGSYVRIDVHIVFSTKDRLPLLGDGVRQRVWDYLGAILRNHGSTPMTIGGTADHVHVLAQLPKDRAVPDVVREVKSNSTRWIREAFEGLERFSWQEGYAAFSITVTGLDRVSGYIAHQEAHHQEKSFQEEFVEFLNQAGVEYDERYIWQ